MKKNIKIVLAAVIFLVSMSLYLNTLRDKFVHDDSKTIVQNHLIASFKNIPLLFTSNYWAGTEYEKKIFTYHPLTALSFAIDHKLFKLKPSGYHFSNIIANSLACVVVFAFCLIVFGQFYPPRDLLIFAFVSSFIFAVHPVHTEAVAEIAGRSELLSAVFYLSAFIFYVNSASRSLYYIISLLLYFAGLLSKEMAVTLPAMIIIYDALSGMDVRKLVKQYIGYFLVFAVYVLARTFVLESFAGVAQSSPAASQAISLKIFTVLKIIGIYIRLLFIPLNLNPFHASAAAQPFFDINAVIGLAFILALAYFLKKRMKEAAFISLWFIVTIFPVANIIPIGGIIGERFLYLPSLSFCFLISGIFVYCLNHPSAAARRGAIAGFVSIITLLSLLTLKQNKTWDSDYTLLKHIAEVEHDDYGANFNFGVFLSNSNRFKESETYLWKAVQLSPESLEAYYQLGVIYFDENLNDKSIETFKKSLELAEFAELKGRFNIDKKTSIYKYLGTLYSRQKDWSLAVKYYQKYVELKANDPDIYYSLSEACLMLNKPEQAEPFSKKVLELRPGDLSADIQLGGILFTLGKSSEAAASYLEALKSDKMNFYANYNLALLTENKNKAEALSYWNTALLSLQKQSPGSQLIERIKNHVIKLEKPPEQAPVKTVKKPKKQKQHK
jgi:tetratricopeptide (TPR) repeat protein